MNKSYRREFYNSSRFRTVHNICLFLFKIRLPLIIRNTIVEIANIFSRIALPPIKDGVIIPTVFDFHLSVSREDGDNYYYLGFYELGTLSVMKHCLKEGNTFIDVGASVGQMSLFASDLVGQSGKVLSFEPMKSRFFNLMKNNEFNNRTNIEIYNIALGDTKGESAFYEIGENNPTIPPIFNYLSSNKRRYGMVGFNEDLNHYDVKLDRLDNILKNTKVNNVKLIKMDVEGYEPYVISGAKNLLSKKDAPIVCFEHDGNFNVENNITIDCFTLLREVNQYQFFKLDHTKKFISKLIEIDLENFEIPRNGDNYFCFLPDHLNQLPKGIFKV